MKWFLRIIGLAVLLSTVYVLIPCPKPEVSHQYQQEIRDKIESFQKQPLGTVTSLKEIVPFNWKEMYILESDNYSTNDDFHWYNHVIGNDVYGGWFCGNRGSSFLSAGNNAIAIVFRGEDGIFYDVDLSKKQNNELRFDIKYPVHIRGVDQLTKELYTFSPDKAFLVVDYLYSNSTKGKRISLAKHKLDIDEYQKHFKEHSAGLQIKNSQMELEASE